MAKHFEKYWDSKSAAQKPDIKGKVAGMYDFVDN